MTKKKQIELEEETIEHRGDIAMKIIGLCMDVFLDKDERDTFLETRVYKGVHIKHLFHGIDSILKEYEQKVF